MYPLSVQSLFRTDIHVHVHVHNRTATHNKNRNATRIVQKPNSISRVGNGRTLSERERTHTNGREVSESSVDSIAFSMTIDDNNHWWIWHKIVSVTNLCVLDWFEYIPSRNCLMMGAATIAMGKCEMKRELTQNSEIFALTMAINVKSIRSVCETIHPWTSPSMLHIIPDTKLYRMHKFSWCHHNGRPTAHTYRTFTNDSRYYECVSINYSYTKLAYWLDFDISKLCRLWWNAISGWIGICVRVCVCGYASTNSRWFTLLRRVPSRR